MVKYFKSILGVPFSLLIFLGFLHSCFFKQKMQLDEVFLEERKQKLSLLIVESTKEVSQNVKEFLLECDDSIECNSSNSKQKNVQAKIKLTKEINPTEAQKKFDERFFILSSLYKPQPTPYPDRISEEVLCKISPKRHVGENENSNFSWMIVGTNNRFAQGICDSNEFSFSAVFFSIYCKQKKSLIEITLFEKLSPSRTLAELETELETQSLAQCKP